jgi:UDP-glucose 4-epimerase
MDRVSGFTVFCANAEVVGRHRIRVSSAGITYHSSNGLDYRNPLSDDRRNFTSRGRISNAMVIRRDLVRHGVRHFIFSSTAAVYGNPERIPVGEDDRTAPTSPYGSSKLMTEIMLRDAGAAHGLRHVILRYFNVAGADPLGRTGQSTRGATHLIKVAVEAAVGKRGHVDVFGTDYDTPDGTGVRDYIHVSDLAAAHVAALDQLVADPGTSHVMNCGYGRGFSVLEVLDSVDRVTNLKIERRLSPRRAGDPPALTANNARILATLPWRPARDELDLIVADALAWERHLANQGKSD